MRFFLACLLVSGCAAAPIIDGATPKSISVRYDKLLGSATEATAVAQEHCQSYGKDAELTAHNNLGAGYRVMNFRCAD